MKISVIRTMKILSKSGNFRFLARASDRYLKAGSQRTFATKNIDESDPTEDKPINYTTSNAAQWRAEFSNAGGKHNEEAPIIQPYSMLFSIAVFLIYFCILREENDLDEILKQYDILNVPEK